MPTGFGVRARQRRFAARARPFICEHIEELHDLPSRCDRLEEFCPAPAPIRQFRHAFWDCIANSPLVDHIIFANNGVSVMTYQNTYDSVNRLTGKTWR